MNTMQKFSILESNIALQETSSRVVLPFDKNGEYYVDNIGDIPAMPIYNFLKRAFDIFASVIGLIVLLIPMLIIAVVIKCVSYGTVFYKQERLGLNGKKFRLLNSEPCEWMPKPPAHNGPPAIPIRGFSRSAAF